MKTVLMTLDAANKQGIAGSEKLTKTDLLVLVYVITLRDSILRKIMMFSLLPPIKIKSAR